MIFTSIRTLLQSCLLLSFSFTNKGLYFSNNKMIIHNNIIDRFIGSPSSNAIICISHSNKDTAYKITPLSRTNINELLFMIDINKTKHKHLPSIIDYSLVFTPKINKTIICNYMNEWNCKYNRPSNYIENKYNIIFKHRNFIIMELPLAKCDVKVFLSKELDNEVIENILSQCIEALNVYHNVTNTIHGDSHLSNFLIYVDCNYNLECKIIDPYLRNRLKLTKYYIKKDMQHLFSSFFYIIKKHNTKYIDRFRIIEKDILLKINDTDTK